MFFIRKLVIAYIQLPGFLILLIPLLLLIFRKKLAKGVKLGLILFTVLLFFFSTPFFARLIIRPLEDIKLPATGVACEGEGIIVVMGGGMAQGLPPIPGVRGEYELGRSSLARLYTAFLVHKQTGFPIVMSGGNYDFTKGTPVADIRQVVLLSWGVAPEKMVRENQARTSLENAENVLLMKATETVLVVTSASHMKRSLLSFKKSAKKMGRQVELIPVPCDYSSSGKVTLYSFLPSKYTLFNVMVALHEYLGLIFYSSG